MQVVDVLRDEVEVVAEMLLEACQRHVRRVGLDAREHRSALVVEPLHQVGVRRERLGGGHRHRVVALPQAGGVTERGQAALGRDPGAGEYDDLHGGRLSTRHFQPVISSRPNRDEF